MTAIEIRGLEFGYGGPPVLRGVDLALGAGEVLAVIGPSGCGKTTLLRLLAGFERPAAGEIVLDGTTVTSRRVHVAPHLRRVGIVPQEGALFPHLDVVGNIGFGLSKHDPGRDARIAELVALAGLEGLEHRLPRQLSGGQQQRVALARALAPRPAVVLLDEPFASLDPQTRLVVRDQVVAMLAREGVTVVLVTHDRAEALTMADQVAVLVGGAVAQCGPPFEVYDAPVDAGVARLLGDAALLPARPLPDGRVETALGIHDVASRRVPGPGHGPVAALVRPEQVAPDADGVRAAVRSVDLTGSGTTLDLELADRTRLRCWMPRARVRPGETLRIAVVGGVHLLPAEEGPAT